MDADELVERLRALLAAGDHRAARSLLVETYHSAIVAILRARDPRVPAEDVAQEVWRTVERILPRYQLEPLPRVWLLVIARSRLVDEQRRHRREVLLDAEILDLHCAEALSRPTSPLSHLLRDEQRERGGALQRALREELDRLRPAERELVELRYLTELKPKEICRYLGLPDDTQSANAISHRLRYAMLKLRDALERYRRSESWRR